MDWNGDGIGDFAGLAQRIDHLADLGVTCLWLMPFYPTAERDDGYDITDFYGVDPRLGTHGDLVEVIRTANDRGMRVIADLVVNHTSRKHPWFRVGRGEQGLAVPRLLRLALRPAAGHQQGGRLPRPGGQHLDAVGEDGGVVPAQVLQGAARPERHQPAGARRGRQDHGLLAAARACPASASTPSRSSWRPPAPTAARSPSRTTTCARCARWSAAARAAAILLGEVNLPYEQQLEFFGGTDGDELTMQFDFIGMQTLYLSLARADAGPLADGARPAARRCTRTPSGPPSCATTTSSPSTSSATTSAQEVFAAFGPEETMQVYGRGLRRRLPPMLDGDPRRVRMVYSLLFSLPGTPVLFYGEEIGMGEDLDAEGRLAVRTPMQWTSGRNGGFSPARAAQAARPGGERRLRPRVRQRRRPAQRPRLAAVVHEAADPPLPGVARSWAGAASRCSSSRAREVLAHLCTLGRRRAGRRCTTSAPSRAPCR